jgi:2-polyprenyl-6-methoxyphenol hydroxylase-like FAD-dependent oxidoreductase
MALADSQFIWVWYDKLDEASQEFRDTFTDITGKKHPTTIPRGKVDPEVWAKRQTSGATLSVPFAELIQKTSGPFVSAIRESITPQAVAHDGKLLLVGDAFCLFRPHTGSSTNQAARQALELAEVYQGNMTLDDWQASSIGHARMTGAISKAFGEYCFTGQIPQSLVGALKPSQRPK